MLLDNFSFIIKLLCYLRCIPLIYLATFKSLLASPYVAITTISLESCCVRQRNLHLEDSASAIRASLSPHTSSSQRDDHGYQHSLKWIKTSEFNKKIWLCLIHSL